MQYYPGINFLHGKTVISSLLISIASLHEVIVLQTVVFSLTEIEFTCAKFVIES